MTKHRTGKVYWRAVIAAGLCACCVFATELAIGAEPLKKMRVAIPSLVIDFAPLWIARDKGIFREEGVEVEITYIHDRERVQVGF